MSLTRRLTRRIAYGVDQQILRTKRLLFEEVRLEHLVGPPGAWQESQRFQFDFLRSQGLSASDELLDLGCGPLRAGLVLVEYLEAGHYVGVDVRPRVIAEAQRQVARRGLSSKHPRVLVSTTFGRDELGDRRFDVVWAFQLLYHLTDDQVTDCMVEIAGRLTRSGVAYANVNSSVPSGAWKQFPYLQRPMAHYLDAGRRAGLDVEPLGSLADLGFAVTSQGQRDQMLRLVPASPTALDPDPR